METAARRQQIETIRRGLSDLEEILRQPSLKRLEGIHTLNSAMRQLGNALLVEAVNAARDDGATWEDVGVAFGMSRQAAQKKFAHAE